MENQDKLLGRLKLDLATLQKDVSKANEILKGIQDTKINPIDIADGKETIKVLRLIQNEFKKIGIDSKSLENMENQLKSLGVNLQETVTKTTTAIRKNNDNQITSIRSVIETMDELGKKTAKIETEKRSYDKKGAFTGSTYSYENISTNEAEKIRVKEYTKEIANLSAEYNKLSREGKLTAENTTRIISSLGDVAKKYELTGTALDKVSKLQDKYNKSMQSSEQNSIKGEIADIKTKQNLLSSSGEQRILDLKKIQAETEKLLTTENLQKNNIVELTGLWKKQTTEILNLTNAHERLNNAALKDYTSQIAQQQVLGKSISERLDTISGIGKNQTLGSGDARNKGFLDRFSIAKDYVVASKIFNTAFSQVDEAYNSISSYESGLVDLSRTLSNVTNKDLKEFGQQAIQMSKDYGVAIEQVQSAMTELARAGVDDKEDLMSMTESVLMGINTTEIKDSSQMVGFLVSTVKQLGMSFQDTNEIIDSWNKLSDKYAVQSNDFAEALQKSGSASKAFGLSLHDINAMTVVLGEATQKSGSEVGNAIKGLETRMLRPETIKTMQDMGIAVMKDAEHFNSFQEIMTQVNIKLDEFGEGSLKANELLDSLGGSWRKNDISVLAKGWEDIDRIAQESMDSVRYSISENEKAMNTLSKQVESFKNSIKELYISFGESGILEQLKSLATGAKNAIEFVSNLPAGFKQWLVILVEVGVAMKGLNSATKLFTGQNLKQWFDVMLSNIGLFSGKFGEGTASMRAFQQASNLLSQNLTAGNITASEYVTILDEIAKQTGVSRVGVDAFKVAKEGLDKQFAGGLIDQVRYNEELKNLVVNTKTASTTNKAYAASEQAVNAAKKSTLVTTIALMATQVAVTVGISALIGLISKMSSASKEAAQRSQEAQQKFEQESDALKNLKTQYVDIIKAGNLTEQSKSQLKSIQDQLIKTYGLEAKALDLVNGKYKDQIAIINEALAKKAKDQMATMGTQYDDANAVLTESDKSKFINQSAVDAIFKVDKDIKKSLSGIKVAKGGYFAVDGTLEERVNKLKNVINELQKIENKDDNVEAIIKGLSTAFTKLNTELETNQSIVQKYIENKNVADFYDTFKADITEVNNLMLELNTTVDKETATKKLQSMKENMLASAEDQGRLGDFKNLIEDMFISIESGNKPVDEIGGVFEDASKAAEELAKAMDTAKQAFDSAKSEISTINKLLDDYATTGELSADAIIDLATKYPQLLLVMNDEKKLVDELNSIKKSQITVAQKNLESQISMNAQYVNTLASQYGIDVTNLKNAESAKVQAVKEGIQQRIALLKTEMDDVKAQYDKAVAVGDTKLAESLGRRLYGMGSQGMGELSKDLNKVTTLGDYYKAVDAMGKSLENYGKSSGGKDKSSKSDSEQISTIDKATTYSSIIDTQNNLLEIQADKISKVKDVISELVDQENYTDAIRQQNNLYAEQKKQLDLLNSTRTKYISTENNISKAFNSKGWFKGQDLNKLTQADFDTMYDKLFSGTRNFGTGEQAEKNKKAFEDNASLFKELTSEWFKMKDAVSSTDKAIGDVSKSMSGIVKDIEELENKALDIVEDTQNKIIDLINKGVEKEKKALDKKYDDKKRALQKEKDLYNEQNNTDDYNKNLSREQAKLNDLNNKIANASRDNSLAGQAKMRDLRQQAEEQQATIDKMILDRTRDVNNTRFDDQAQLLDDQHKSSMDSLDELYSEEKVKAMAQTAILTGYFKDVNNSIVDVKTEFGKFEDELGTGITLIANKVKNEFTAALKEAQKTLKDMSTISLSVNTVKDKLPSYAVGTTRLLNDQVAQVHKNEAILPAAMNPFLGGKSLDNFMTNVMPTFKVPSFSMPNLSGMSGGSGSPIVNFNQPLISVSGDVSEGMIPTLKDLGASIKGIVTEVLIDEFHNQGIPMH